MDIFNKNSVIANLEVSMKGLKRRFKASTANIANAETPFFTAKQVIFEDSMSAVQHRLKNHGESALLTTHAEHFNLEPNSIIETEISTINSMDEENTNFNNVHIDREMVVMAKTGMKFKAITKMTRKVFDHLNGIIKA